MRLPLVLGCYLNPQNHKPQNHKLLCNGFLGFSWSRLSFTVWECWELVAVTRSFKRTFLVTNVTLPFLFLPLNMLMYTYKNVNKTNNNSHNNHTTTTETTTYFVKISKSSIIHSGVLGTTVLFATSILIKSFTFSLTKTASFGLMKINI